MSSLFLRAFCGSSNSQRLRLFDGALQFFFLAGMILVAFCHARKAAERTDWPFLYDSLRDVGMAQSMLYGRYPEDHLLSGETLWFNPLVAGLVAAASRLADLPSPAADIVLGPFLNLLLPLGLYLLASMLFDRWTGVAAALVLLFGNSLAREHNPYTIAVCNIATYSPWLFAPHLAQGILYVTLALYWKAITTGAWRWYLAAGVAWGVTFMTHTAPALVVGGTGLIITAVSWFHTRRSREPSLSVLARFTLMAAVAFLASLPYTYSILWNYQFHILNNMPSRYVTYDVNIEQLPQFLRDQVGPFTVLAVLGLIRLRKSIDSRTAWFVASLLIVVLAFLGEAYFAQLDPSGNVIPQIVPTHHFAICLSSVKALLAGAGLVSLARFVGASLLSRLNRSEMEKSYWGTIVESGAPCLACVLVFAATYPSYRAWPEFTRDSKERVYYPVPQEERERAYQWILDHSTPDDVFLTEDDDQLSLLVVGPAARKVVVTMWIFTNPYVDCATRRKEREALFKALETRDEQSFRQLASKYRLRYILIHKDRLAIVQDAFPFIRPAFESPSLRLFEISALP